MTSLPLASTAPRASKIPLRSALQLRSDPYTWWPKKYLELGPVYRVAIPTDRKPWIVIAGREANELVAKEGAHLFNQKATYPKAPKVLRTELHPSFTEGALQRHLRRQVAPGFSRQAADPHLPAMMSWVREYVDRWSPGQVIRVTEETSRIGLNCISLFATGRELDGDSEDIRKYAISFTQVLALGWPLAALNFGRTKRAREALDGMIEQRLAEHEQTPPGRDRAPDYFDFLLRGTLPDGSPLPARERVVFGQIPFKNMGVYAGRVINHVLMQLVQRPEVLEQVLPEIDRVMADDELTLEEIASMEATQAAVKETLRILPTAVTLQRTVGEPFEFGGYQFEVGDRLFTPLSATHFLPEFFPDPERFDIDRYSPERGEDRQRYVYNPFGLGHHACVAQGVFEALTMVVVGSVLYRWKLEAPYKLNTIFDALPGPDPKHQMRVIERRTVAPPPGVRRRSPTQRYSLSAAMLDAIDGAPEVTLADDELLFAQGDQPDCLYFILDGKLRVSTDRGDGEVVELATLGPGEVVGEIGILHGLPRVATVRAEGPVTLLSVDEETFARAVVESDITARELGDLAVRRHAGALIAQLFDTGRRMPRLGRHGHVLELELEAGTTLFRHGDPAENYFLVASGSLEELAESLMGEPRVLRVIQAPDCIGEIGLIDGRPRPTTVRAGPNGAKLLSLDRDAFVRVSQGDESQAAVSLVAKIRFDDSDDDADDY
ncbi:cytochrome P450 [Enhygromyxa salina]|uniref:Putative cytochrome P450 120 n=1 Tax=Enhygromyxa salina TaxID=215803 RepID=A0A2S9XPJ1_9BACT|nr:cytochrome P450 [Enhygromyxa salina]PRP94784.1 putative cytochrome P450 120 [Enhygromyxa salina]